MILSPNILEFQTLGGLDLVDFMFWIECGVFLSGLAKKSERNHDLS